MTHTGNQAQPAASPQFTTTQWSLVLAAGGSTSPESRDALARLCESYWYPLYAYVRRQGHGRDESQDLTQGFFVMLLDQDSFATVDEAKGKLRSFLLVALKRFAANEYKRGRTQKRGGGSMHVPINSKEA